MWLPERNPRRLDQVAGKADRPQALKNTSGTQLKADTGNGVYRLSWSVFVLAVVACDLQRADWRNRGHGGWAAWSSTCHALKPSEAA